MLYLQRTRETDWGYSSATSILTSVAKAAYERPITSEE